MMAARFLCVILFFTFPQWNIHHIAQINTLKKEAKLAFYDANYSAAIEKYRFLTDTLELTEGPLLFNLATSYYQLKDTVHLMPAYQQLTVHPDKYLKSAAFQQLGVITHKKSQTKEALDYFKKALKSDPTNEAARYNYELLKKLLKRQEQEENKKKDWPSDFAKNLKEQADKLVARYKFEEAYTLMMEGMEQDESVMFYQEFIMKLQTILMIDLGI
jgi:tetratricopeptide (TPR) repeat protein